MQCPARARSHPCSHPGVTKRTLRLLLLLPLVLLWLSGSSYHQSAARWVEAHCRRFLQVTTDI